MAALVILTRLPESATHLVQAKALLNLSEPHYGLPVCRCLAEFPLGILTARVLGTKSGARFRDSPLSSTIVSVVLLVLLCIPRSDLAVTLLFPVMVLSLSSDAGILGRLLSSVPVHNLGLLSYGIYMVHFLVAGILPWVHRIAHNHGLSHAQTYATAVGLVLTFPISFLAYTYIEVPGRNVLRNAFEGSSRFRLQSPTGSPTSN